MRHPLPTLDSEKSYRMVCAQVEQAVKGGSLSREQAHKIVSDAREAYRKQAYNREVEARNRVDK